MRKFWLIWFIFSACLLGNLLNIDIESLIVSGSTNLSQNYVNQFDYENARNLIDHALAIYPANAILLTERGKISMVLYEWDTALADLNRALEVNPQYTDAYFFRGDLLYTRVERELALVDFQTYLSLKPHGLYASQAQKAIESIQIELNTLGGSH